jgi:phosphoserine phosphatase
MHMPAHSSKPTVLVTVSGPDQPGITSEMTGILAKASSPILDLAQAVIHGLLSLSILFEVNDDQGGKTVIKDLLFKAAEMGLKLEFRAFEANSLSRLCSI